MNIIEQLGGYGAAKAKLESLNGQFYKTMEPERFLFEMDNQQKLSVIISALEIAMLEYRRQHNIFEVWDLVIDTNYKDSDIQEIKSVNGNKIEVFHKNKAYYFATYIFSFRHATDAEIKAGKRL